LTDAAKARFCGMAPGPPDPPDWQEKQKGRARDQFGADPAPPKTPEPEKKPEPASEDKLPSEAKPVGERERDKLKLELNPKFGQRLSYDAAIWKSREAGKRPLPRKHTKEQIQQWAKDRQEDLNNKNGLMQEAQKERHAQQRKTTLFKYQQRVTENDAEPLQAVVKRQQEEDKRLADLIDQQQSNLTKLVNTAFERGTINDRDWLIKHDLERDRERDRGRDGGID
jgi:hypothetical protein